MNYTPPEPYATLHHDDGYFTTTKREHDLRYSGPVRTKAFTTDQLRAEVERVRRETVEECAKICDDYASDKWSLYKGRPPYNGTEQGRADPDTQGHSDGASNCADKLRELLK